MLFLMCRISSRMPQQAPWIIVGVAALPLLVLGIATMYKSGFPALVVTSTGLLIGSLAGLWLIAFLSFARMRAIVYDAGDALLVIRGGIQATVPFSTISQIAIFGRMAAIAGSRGQAHAVIYCTDPLFPEGWFRYVPHDILRTNRRNLFPPSLLDLETRVRAAHVARWGSAPPTLLRHLNLNLA